LAQDALILVGREAVWSPARDRMVLLQMPGTRPASSSCEWFNRHTLMLVRVPADEAIAVRHSHFHGMARRTKSKMVVA
jgi:hypothetical protein